jgi:hypothetical protein
MSSSGFKKKLKRLKFNDEKIDLETKEPANLQQLQLCSRLMLLANCSYWQKIKSP